MSNALMFRITANSSSCYRGNDVVVSSCSLRLGSVRLPVSSRRFSSFTAVQSVEDASSEPSVSSDLTSAVGSSLLPRPAQWAVATQRHIHFLSIVACTAAISATWLFCSAIPALLAFRRAAESLEKLMDVTREELPDTMAAVRLSGMEISDLTMELSDLGQEITQGVRNSTRAIHVAEERLRRLTSTNTTVLVQEAGPRAARASDPPLAKSARGAREGIVKGRAALRTFFALTRYSKVLFNFFRSRAKA